MLTSNTHTARSYTQLFNPQKIVAQSNGQIAINTAYYAQIAGLAGANVTTFNARLSSKKYQTKIDAQANEAMGAGAQGTPFVVVLNTKTGKTAVIPGALPEAQANAVINSVK